MNELKKLTIPKQVFDLILSSSSNRIATILEDVMRYAYEGIEPSKFYSSEARDIFNECRALLDPLIKKARAAEERAENCRLERENDPEGYARRQRERQMKKLEKFGIDKLPDFSTQVTVIQLLIRNKRLQKEIITAQYCKINNLEYDGSFDIIYDKYGAITIEKNRPGIRCNETDRDI